MNLFPFLFTFVTKLITKTYSSLHPLFYHQFSRYIISQSFANHSFIQKKKLSNSIIFNQIIIIWVIIPQILDTFWKRKKEEEGSKDPPKIILLTHKTPINSFPLTFHESQPSTSQKETLPTPPFFHTAAWSTTRGQNHPISKVRNLLVPFATGQEMAHVQPPLPPANTKYLGLHRCRSIAAAISIVRGQEAVRQG